MIIWRTDLIQGTKEWLAAKAGLWSGSTAIRLLQGKMLLPQSDWDGNDATRRGQALEFAAIREYERKYRCKVFRPGGVQNTVYPNAWYSPDGIDGSWLLECKAFLELRHELLIISRAPLKELADIIASKIPLTVRVQIFFGMIITGKRKARLLAFNPENEEQLIVVEIGYDKLIGNNIRRKLREDMKKRRSI